eukprot:1572510-Pyramimonas_sp.AAC.1
MLISNTAIEEPARIETADLFTQLGVSWLALVLSGGVFVILPRRSCPSTRSPRSSTYGASRRP